MSETDGAAWLTAGPRGRRLLWSLLDGRPGDRSAVSLVAEIGQAPDDGVPAGRLLGALAHAVDFARYWQEPDGVDRALGLEEVRDALLPVARRVAAVIPPWWSGPVERSGQRIVEWKDPMIAPASLTGAADKLTAWRTATAEDERRAVDLPRDVRVNYSGQWWSAPCNAGLPTTTGAPAGLGAAALVLTEDSMGWDEAVCRPVAAVTEPRVLEIVDAADWIALVERHPLEVSLSRRHDWWRATGVEGSWLMPDFAALRQDVDAVHLTVRGYLAAAGVALPVGAAHTMLAGWNPDETYWLTDRLVPDGPPERWVRDGGTPGWRMRT